MDETKEIQYQDCVKLAHERGLSSLGIMTNQVWYDDPRRLVFTLSRYKFVSKMLQAKQKVAEVGCGDGFGSRIVQQTVGHLDLYDFDPIFVDNANEQNCEKWPVNAHLHDILDGPLVQIYDAAYSLDVMEHIPETKEDIYLENLKNSLCEKGVVIIGMPSLESQTYASPQSKIGHINCKSGPDLEKAVLRHFEHCFLFSMNDEVVHTGFHPMAHYLFAIGCK